MASDTLHRDETEPDHQPQAGGEPAYQPQSEPEAEPDIATGTAPVPGAVNTEPDVTLWPAQQTEQVQARWRELQLRFVDDPRTAAEQAQALVTETVDSFTAALASRKQELDTWHDTGASDGDGSDTEQMRVVVRRYRELLDRLLEV